MCPDIMSTGFSGAERGGVQIGDTVVVFALGPIGLCAVAGAKLMGAGRIIGVDTVLEAPGDSPKHSARIMLSTSKWSTLSMRSCA